MQFWALQCEIYFFWRCVKPVHLNVCTESFFLFVTKAEKLIIYLTSQIMWLFILLLICYWIFLVLFLFKFDTCPFNFFCGIWGSESGMLQYCLCILILLVPELYLERCYVKTVICFLQYVSGFLYLILKIYILAFFFSHMITIINRLVFFFS